ncbi:MAG: SdrD B-like domain-containing protein, partial [Ferruginibacter sp.]
MNKILTLLMAIFCIAINVTTQAQTTGTVFRDYNGNGTRQTTAPDLEPLVAGIIVNAYNSADVLVASYTTTSAAAPNFSIPLTGSAYNGTPGSNTGSVNTGVAVRLEFIIPASGVCGLNPNIDYSTGNGLTVGSSVRFISGGATTVNYAVHNPADFKGATTNPLTFTTRFSNGDPNAAGPGAVDGFLGFPYNNTGTTAPSRTFASSNMGSIWGLAYSRVADRMFAAAYVKRHWGLKGSTGQIFSITNLASGIMASTAFFDFDNGIDGIAGNADDIPTRYNGSQGAITYGTAAHYSISGTAPTHTITYNVSTIDPISNLPAGIGVVGTNAQRALPTNTSNTSNDPAAFGQVGRVGLGDIEISDDGLFLYVVNLYDRKLYRLTLNSATNPTAVTAVTSYSLPTPPARSSKGGGFATTYAASNTNFYTGVAGGGYQRPFGLKFWRGKVYVGAVTTGETGGTSTKDNNTGNPEYTDLWAYVWEFDAATAAFNTSPLLQEPQNFNRGINGDGKDETWKPWTNTLQGHVTTGSQPADSRYYYYAQPMLTGIEFDNDGSMILGFRDRLGDQTGYDQPPLSGPGTGFNGALSLAIDGITTGDILRAYRNPAGCGFVMETNATAGGITTTGAGNSQGPSNYTGANGEFYYQDGLERYNGGAGEGTNWHVNTGLGALAIVPGDDKVTSTAIDPLATWTNGVSKMSNVNGSNPSDYQLFGALSRVQLGKSAALGDLELLLPNPPIEIGNRIWNDADGDGIQEPGEAGIAGVTLQLVDAAGNPVDSDPGTAGVQATFVTTDATGNWYITSATGTDATGINFGVALLPNTQYRLRLATGAGDDWDPTLNGGQGGPRAGQQLVGLGLSKTNKIGNGAADLSDNDAAMVGAIPEVTITTGGYGQNNHSIDFGFKALASLGDKVWRDDNQNGIQDAGEPGVAGITVTLYDNAGIVIGTTVTDAYGLYLFDNLTPATYQVGFTAPANYNFTTQTNNTDNTVLTGGSTAANGSDVNATTGRSANIVLTAGELERNIDAGLIFSQPANNSIGDRVWLDTDGGGTQNGTEPGISGVTVTLFASDGVTIVATTVTDANGNYLFSGLPATTNYIVGITLPAGLTFTSTTGTTPGNATINSDVSATTGKTTTINTGAAGNQITGIDAGLILTNSATASLGDKVWIDLPGGTANVQDAGEPGLAGVTVNLYRDANADGIINGAEASTPYATTVTDAFGNYIFNNLPAVALPGTVYQVRFVLPGGYTFVTANVGTDDFKNSDADATGLTKLYRISAGQRNLSVDAGVTQNSPAGTARLGDMVWFDADNDGIQDAGEPGIAGVTVTLFNSGGTAIGTTSTDAYGYYQFINLAAGSYSVGFSNLPAGYSFTSSTGTTPADATTNSDANPATGRTANFALLAAQSLQGLDAGLIAGIASGLGSIGNKVWYDLPTGTTGVQDAGELGVAGVTVTLLDAGADGIVGNGDDGASRTTITNALGEYIFTGLPAGNYAVQFSNLPGSYTVTTANAGIDDNLDSDGGAVGTGGAPAGASRTGVYNLGAGEDNLTVDLGLVPPANTNTLGNYVWFDKNSDGIQDVAEQGIAGVMVTLYNNAGTAIALTTTNLNGEYLFTGLADGNYSTGFTNLPAGFDFTTASITNTANGSDADRTSGRTAIVTLNAGNRNDRSLDAGLISSRAALGNYVWMDSNGDGVQTAGELPVAGVTVSLFRPGFGLDGIAGNADDALPVASMITDQNGQYLFENLFPGTYQVAFTTLPSGILFTQQDAGGNDNLDSDVNPATGLTANILLNAGDINLTVDAGLFKPRAVIGNYIWADKNNNGIQDTGEPGFAGVVVTLFNGGIPVATAVT